MSEATQPRYTDVTGPSLETRLLRLRPVRPDDYAFLYGLGTDPETGFRWRYRGYVPGHEEFVRDLARESLVGFTVEDKKSGNRAGLVTAYSADVQDGYAFVSIIMAPRYVGSGCGMEATLLFLNYLFAIWGFRKLYAEMIAFNYPAVASGEGRLFQVEGCLREHHYYNSKYWDKYLLAIYRTDFERDWRPLIARLAPKRRP